MKGVDILFKKILSMVMAGVMVMCVGGCSKNMIQSSALTDEVTAQKVETLEMDEEFRTHSMDFAFELYKNSDAEDENTLVSPLSVMLALGMTANGAGGNTLAQFEKLLGDGISAEDISKYYKSYVDALPSTDKSKIAIANSIWINNIEGLRARPTFLQKSVDYYEAQAYQADFDADTVKDINQWVYNNTDGMIDGIISDLSPEAIMVLINAISFDAEWESIYEAEDVKNIEFITREGKKQSVKGMYGKEQVYLEDENTTGFIKKYKDGYSFVALLPNEDVSIEEYVNSLTGEKFANLIDNRQSTLTYTMIPKFKYEYKIKLSQPLCNMGLSDMFNPLAADFSALIESDNGNVHVDEVLHKTFIEMSEKGTRAAAVTAIIEKNSVSFQEEGKRVYLNRPFVYVIMDDETNLPIFIGTVLEIE